MDRRLTYPALAAFALSAAAAGAFLGQSAIDQINPLYFQGAAVHPRDRGAALEEALLVQRPRFADHFGWEEGQAARTADCGADYAAIEPRWYVEPQPATYYIVEQAQQAAPEEQPAPAEPSDIERYAAFPVEEKPAEAEPAAVEVAWAKE